MKSQFFLRLMTVVLLFAFTACDSEECETSICQSTVLISAEAYENGADDPITIISMNLDGDCLTIEYGASGCSGDSWVVQFIDSGAVAESEPPQRYLRLSLDNPEACLAYFTKTTSFDISSLKIDDGPIILNIANNEESITY